MTGNGRQQLTMVFTDIEDSTAINERLGDEAWLELLLTHNAIVRHRARRHGGREVRFRGDGFLLAFDRPADAARCAVSIQRAIADRAESSPQLALRIRLGMHHGPALSEGGDLLGANVNLAERIVAAARGAEILVSSPCRELLGQENLCFGDARDVDLAGSPGTQRLFPLSWRRTALEPPARLAVAA